MFACIPTSSDHINNPVTHGATTITDLEDDLEFANVAVDISMKMSVLPAFNEQFPKIPISYTAGILLARQYL